jgi:hypothetical protein
MDAAFSIVGEDDVTIELKARLPDGVKGIAYEKNSHWIELVDDHGERTHLPATSLVLYKCDNCGERWFLLINRGKPCGQCTVSCEPTWMHPQLAFVPENPSNFTPPSQKKVHE